jgi:hypothetical protein
MLIVASQNGFLARSERARLILRILAERKREPAVYALALTMMILSFTFATISKADEPDHFEPAMVLPQDANPIFLTAAERNSRLADITKNALSALDRVTLAAGDPQSDLSTRELAAAAYGELLLRKNVPSAARLLNKLLTLQNRDPRSPNYGTVPARVYGTSAVKETTLELTSQPLGPIIITYGKLLPAPLLIQLKDACSGFIRVITRHRIPTTRTSLYVARACDLILLGEAVHSEEAISDGCSFLDQFINYTKIGGIHEFASASLYARVLDSLGTAYTYEKNPETKAKIKAVLDYFWLDIYANYFPQQGCLGGAHGYDADFIMGDRGLDLYLSLEGLKATLDLSNFGAESVYAIANEQPESFHPSKQMFNLTALHRRTLLQRYGIRPIEKRFTYITQNYAIGHANGYCGPQDKLVNIDLASPKKLPSVTIIGDNTDQPYPVTKLKYGDEPLRPFHPPLRMLAVQDEGILAAFPRLTVPDSESVPSVATNILLPSDVDGVYLDGQKLDVKKPFQISLKSTSVVTLQEGQTGVAVRVFAADGLHNQTASYFLKADRVGLSYKVFRIAIYHYHGPSARLSEKQAQSSILFCVDRCKTTADIIALTETVKKAKVYTERIPNYWRGLAIVDPIKLIVRLSKDERDANQLLDNVKLTYHSFLVNGQDLGDPIWRTIGSTSR